MPTKKIKKKINKKDFIIQCSDKEYWFIDGSNKIISPRFNCPFCNEKLSIDLVDEEAHFEDIKSICVKENCLNIDCNGSASIIRSLNSSEYKIAELKLIKDNNVLIFYDEAHEYGDFNLVLDGEDIEINHLASQNFDLGFDIDYYSADHIKVDLLRNLHKWFKIFIQNGDMIKQINTTNNKSLIEEIYKINWDDGADVAKLRTKLALI